MILSFLLCYENGLTLFSQTIRVEELDTIFVVCENENYLGYGGLGLSIFTLSSCGFNVHKHACVLVCTITCTLHMHTGKCVYVGRHICLLVLVVWEVVSMIQKKNLNLSYSSINM